MNVNAIRERFLKRVRARSDEEKDELFQNLKTTTLGHLMCEREVFSFLSDSDYQTGDISYHTFFIAETPVFRDHTIAFDYSMSCSPKSPTVFEEADSWLPPIAA
ncbi:hypothetical protein LCL63_001707 [Vibrio fluvialis]|nr:hypothetical protein [Vibrio fluvialis]